MFLCFFFYSISSKAVKAGNKNFITTVKKNPYSVVLFTSPHCFQCRRIISTMDDLSVKYNRKVGMVFVDVTESQEIVSKYGIQFSPQIVIFHHDVLIKKYYGEWNLHSLTNLCEKLLSSDITYLNSTFDVFKFQHKGRANLILSSDLANQADKILFKYGGAFHIGVIDNDSILEQLDIPNSIITRPKESFTHEITNIDNEDLIELSTTPFVHVKNAEIAGSSTTPNTLFALIDCSDESHIYETIRRMKLAREHFGQNISFQYCDFFTCETISKQIGIISYAQPVFLLNIKTPNGQQMLEPFRKVINKPPELLRWLRSRIEGVPEEEIEEAAAEESEEEKEEKIELPILHGNEFMIKALNPNIDAVLFVANDDMPMYQQTKKRLYQMMKLFEPLKTVKFFEFDPEENVPGLNMPMSGLPQVSVWPASKEYNGSSFTACTTLQNILENLLKLIKTEVSDELAAEMMEQLQGME
ncbi:thioredoxin [Histomonas meleagridis]|uniref:thioredoxin n=1 Tax=Histomonas meleagridis TaxID=135588 RepID=UPI003559AF81|nr:thioredoxin [Histomonas meleagridis]KAH0804648.1 thioredoxin [Histomonas meleagridis]